MQFPAVNWHEGLFLQPHHFQAWDRHWTERICTGEQWQTPYSYGVLEIEINQDALSAGFLQVDKLRCKTPGGTLIEWLHGATDRRDLRPAFDVSVLLRANEHSTTLQKSGLEPIFHESRYVDVYVAVPRLKLGSQNVDSPEHRNGSRFRAQWLDLPDELDAASIQPVELREVNARILFSTEDLAGFDTLKIARVRRADQEDVQLRLDPQYIPPLLDCGASELLRTQILSSIYDLVQQQSELIAKQVQEAGGILHANTPIDVQRFMILQAVNPIASVLQVMTLSKGIHPLTLYLELSRLAGALDVFSTPRSAKPTPAYDHEDLGRLLFALKRRILRSMDSLERPPYRQIAFLGTEYGMQAEIDRSLILSAKRWFIGIHQKDITPDALHRIMASGNLDWKLGSTSDVERIFTMRAPGVEIRRTQEPHASLPRSADWTYYEITTKDSHPWRDVMVEGSLAMRFRDSMLSQRENRIGAKEIQIVVGHQTVSMQFALFGVD